MTRHGPRRGAPGACATARDPTAAFAALRALAPFDDGALSALAALATPRHYASGDSLLRAGTAAEWCHLLVSGLVREFQIGADGGEHTRAFVCAGDLTGSLYDLLSGAAAITTIQALEDTMTWCFRYREFDALCTRFPSLHEVARRVAERLYQRKVRREHDMLALSAAERLAQWSREHRALDARVSRRALASYLGITPEHLSRLRRRERDGG